jgi:hypothetical protein
MHALCEGKPFAQYAFGTSLQSLDAWQYVFEEFTNCAGRLLGELEFTIMPLAV